MRPEPSGARSPPVPLRRTAAKRPVPALRVLAALGLAAFPALTGCASDGTRPLAFATGTTAGIYYPLGGAISSRWTREIPGVVVKAEVTAGSVTNLIQVAKGESEVGIGQADAVADAVAGSGRFPEPLPISVLGRLYPNVVHLLSVAGRGVEAVEDLPGKRVSVGPPGSGNEVTARNLLRAAGIPESELRIRQMNYTQSINGLKDGALDALFLAAGLGVSSVIELGLTRDLVLVPFTEAEIARIEEANPAYQGFVVPPGVYPGVEAGVRTPSLWNLLFVHEEMPADLAGHLAGSLLTGREEFRPVTRNAEFIRLESLDAVGALPLHPGAAAFYGEERRRRRETAPGDPPAGNPEFPDTPDTPETPRTPESSPGEPGAPRPPAASPLPPDLPA